MVLAEISMPAVGNTLLPVTFNMLVDVSNVKFALASSTLPVLN